MLVSLTARPGAFGGAIYCTNGQLSLFVTTVIANTATSAYQQAFGGGVDFDAGGLIDASLFEGNIATSQISYAYGGGVSSEGALSVFRHSVFRQNLVVGNGVLIACESFEVANFDERRCGGRWRVALFSECERQRCLV